MSVAVDQFHLGREAGLDVVAAALDPAAMFHYAGLRPDGWQGEELRAFWSHGDHLGIVAPRRRGKSATAAALVAHSLVFVPGFQSAVAGPTERHGIEFIRAVREFFLATPAAFRPRLVAEAAGKLETSNGGRLVAGTANPSSLRSLGCDVLVLDEACYLSAALLEAGWPVLLERQGRMVAVSTPSAGDSWLRAVFEDEERDGPGAGWRRRYVHPWDSDRPEFAPALIERQRARMSESAFTREYGGEWEDADLGVLEALSPFPLADEPADAADALSAGWESLLRRKGYRQ